MKYRNKKIEIEGEVFDSKLEAKRWYYLKELEEEKVIRNLRRQVPFELLSRQTYPIVTGKRIRKFEEKFAERPVEYVADFAYESYFESDDVVATPGYFLFLPDGRKIDLRHSDILVKEKSLYVITHEYGKLREVHAQGWFQVIEDTKGYHTKDYVIKRKLMFAMGFRIREIKEPFEKI